MGGRQSAGRLCRLRLFSCAPRTSTHHRWPRTDQTGDQTAHPCGVYLSKHRILSAPRLRSPRGMRRRMDDRQNLSQPESVITTTEKSPSRNLQKKTCTAERDYQELKSELGLAHFEGRGWRGFHHHATLCVAAYRFQIRERAAIPPMAPCSAKNLAFPLVQNQEAPPTRPERHVENSMATVRRKLTVVLARPLPRCPCCQSIRPKPTYHQIL